jgi:hypothetical protein
MDEPVPASLPIEARRAGLHRHPGLDDPNVSASNDVSTLSPVTKMKS